MNGKISMLSEKCRERRRKRIEMRRMPYNDSSPYIQSQKVTQWSATNFDLNSGSNNQIMYPWNPMMPPPVLFRSPPVASSSRGSLQAPNAIIPRPEPSPVAGVMSVTGFSQKMEDTVSIVPNLCKPEINNSRPVHFFGVFDGHGSVHVAAQCKDKMPVFMEQELMIAGKTGYTGKNVGLWGKEIPEEGSEEEMKLVWTKAIEKCFRRMDKLALSLCPCRNLADRCICNPLKSVLSGSTAIVALVTPEHIIAANCGDSRAVLCRAGRCIPLSADHKPGRIDEFLRISASGGQILNVNGGERVEGILAMTRALGDGYLKRVITSEPEICFMKRDPMDECLIIASDGLWDVVSSRLACEIASNCLKHGPVGGLGICSNQAEFGLRYPTVSKSTATLLARLAMGRKSSDNVSVVVVDLRT